MWPFIGHYELEVDAKELPAKLVVMCGLDDVAEPNRHDPGVTPVGAYVDTMAGDRVEGIEIHHVLAGLAVDPVDRGLDRQPPQVVAEIPRCRVETHDRQIAADRQQRDPRAVPADI